MPARKAAQRQHRRWRRHLQSLWRVGGCRVSVRVLVAFVHGRAAARQPDGARSGCRSHRGGPPAQERPRRGVDRGARHPCRALRVEGPPPR
jgi:hypothetical protein